MQDKLAQASQAVYDFVTGANPDDEFFMITFSDGPVQVVDFDTPLEEIENQLLYLVPKGSTALLDALYLGLTKMQSAKYSRRAILIVSDGGDNHSRYTEREVRGIAKEADVMIYAIGIYDRFFETEEERLGPALLADLSGLTGGRDFVIESPSDLVDVANKIGIELRNLYVLSYTPKDTLRDGKWHKINVKLMPPKGLPALRAHAKEGYYAPIE
jgi:Ca-activated chloride channel family protein